MNVDLDFESSPISGLPTTSAMDSPVRLEFEKDRIASGSGGETKRSDTEREPSWMWHGSPTIPTEHKARTLVLCFDGTGDQ